MQFRTTVYTQSQRGELLSVPTTYARTSDHIVTMYVGG